VPALMFAAVAALTVSRVAAAGPWLPAPGEFYSEFRAGAFTADTWLNRDGERRALYGGGSEQLRSLASYNELGWKKNMSFVLGLPVVSVTRRDMPGMLEDNQTGMSDLRLGLRYKIADGPNALALEADWKAPLGYDRHGLSEPDSATAVRQQSPPRLGDGQQDITAALHYGTVLKRLHGFLQLAHGFRWRAEDPASQAVFGADLGFWLRPSLLLVGRYRGGLDVGPGKTDADETDFHLVSPELVYRVDDRLDLIVGSTHTAAGKNVLHMDEVHVAVAFRQLKLDKLQSFLSPL
jgi:hypothetical protein